MEFFQEHWQMIVAVSTVIAAVVFFWNNVLDVIIKLRQVRVKTQSIPRIEKMSLNPSRLFLKVRFRLIHIHLTMEALKGICFIFLVES